MNLRTPAAGAAAFLLAAGVVVGAATPASADPAEADLEISLVGTTIAENAPTKFATLTITNHGPGDATGNLFEYDVSDLDTDKVEFFIEGCEPDTDGVALCEFIDLDALEAGAKVTEFAVLNNVTGVQGDAGSVTVRVWHEGDDPDSANDEVIVPVRIDESGADLGVFVPDIAQQAEIVLDETTQDVEIDVSEDVLLPGSATVVQVFVDNDGDQAAIGVTLTLDLPEHVTFREAFTVCTHEAGGSSTTCTADEFVLFPSSGGVFFFPVQVAEDAPSPAALTGGEAQVWAIDHQPMDDVFLTLSTPQLPSSQEDGIPFDVDPTDNRNAFTVFVSEVPDDGGIGGGGELPKTGMPALLIGGVGAGALFAGVVLFLLARRRKVVLESPSTLAG